VRAKGVLKWPSGADILPVKSMKLSKGIMPRAIASAAMVCITPEVHGLANLFGASGSKAGRGDPGSKTISKAKKDSGYWGPSYGISEGIQESSPHDQALEVQLKAGLHGQTPG
jgi:hypothetical protein